MSRPQCPADRQPWRDTAEGPMPMLVPAEALEGMRRRYPKIWIELLPAEILLLGQTLMLSDVWPAKP